MKTLFVLCFVGLVGLSVAYGRRHDRGCVYDDRGLCMHECEEGTHGYSIGCGYVTPEATCDNPRPVPDTEAEICDVSACYCDFPTVRDTVSKKCVRLKDCPRRRF